LQILATQGDFALPGKLQKKENGQTAVAQKGESERNL
jgi:hypothetical protein